MHVAVGVVVGVAVLDVVLDGGSAVWIVVTGPTHSVLVPAIPPYT
jgi:hypothetical protein